MGWVGGKAKKALLLLSKRAFYGVFELAGWGYFLNFLPFLIVESIFELTDELLAEISSHIIIQIPAVTIERRRCRIWLVLFFLLSITDTSWSE